MAITKQKKEEVVARVAELINDSKLTVFANYSGVSVKDMQELRRSARESDVKITVAKNRLVKIALANDDVLKSVDTGILEGQLAMAVSPGDEVAPAQVLANFAKTNPSLEIVGAYDGEGKQLSADEVKALSKLPSKDVLRGQLVGTIAAPLSGFVRVVNGNLSGLVNVLNARKEAIT